MIIVGMTKKEALNRLPNATLVNTRNNRKGHLFTYAAGDITFVIQAGKVIKLFDN